MELEELKNKWEIMSKQIEKQTLVSKKLLDNVVVQKMNHLVSYNWFGIILTLIAIPIVIFLGMYKNIAGQFIYSGVGMLIVFFIWGIYNFRLLLKTKSYKNNLISAERATIKYRNNTIWYYMTQYLFATIYVIWLIASSYKLLVQFNRLEIIIIAVIVTFALTIFEYRWYIGKIKELHNSIEELKSFES